MYQGAQLACCTVATFVIERALGRLQVACELVEGDIKILRDRGLCFYLMRDAAGAYSLQYRPGELAAARRSKTLVERASA
jgi:hypothetical protein